MIFLLILSLLLTVGADNPCRQANLSEPQSLVCNQIFSWFEKTKGRKIQRGRARHLKDAVDNFVPLPNEFAVVSNATNYPPRLDDVPNEETIEEPVETTTEEEGGKKRVKRQSPPNIYTCMDIPCICSYLSGTFTGTVCNLPDGSVYGKAIRKDIRMMTYTEIQLFAQAFWAAVPGIYWQLSGYHGDVTQSPGAHSGPNFLGWHREFLKRMEIGMRIQVVGGRRPYINVALPYWDSSMDDDIYRIFGISSSYSGSVLSGYLNDGFFGGWYGRNVGVRFATGKKGDSGTCPNVPNNNLEVLHGYIHVWVGGNMQYITTSTNDPVFFLHHTFIDYIWEKWRLRNQNRVQRESQWNSGPTSCYAPAHAFNAIMIPFTSHVNRDGLSNKYTDNLITYQERPSCSASVPCGSSYLWCHTGLGRCVSRLKVGSPCALINGVNPCVASSCVGGRCTA